ncbi:MAG: TRAM domain-containing protein [Anaerolineae bacterium]
MSDTVIVEIEKVANGGFSLGRHNRRVTFVPYVLPGERVRARHTQVEKSFAKARPVEVLRAAPDRVEAPCPHYGVCGGCHWQHAAYQAQLDLKRETVLDQFERIG